MSELQQVKKGQGNKAAGTEQRPQTFLLTTVFGTLWARGRRKASLSSLFFFKEVLIAHLPQIWRQMLVSKPDYQLGLRAALLLSNPFPL